MSETKRQIEPGQLGLVCFFLLIQQKDIAKNNIKWYNGYK